MARERIAALSVDPDHAHALVAGVVHDPLGLGTPLGQVALGSADGCGMVAARVEMRGGLGAGFSSATCTGGI